MSRCSLAAVHLAVLRGAGQPPAASTAVVAVSPPARLAVPAPVSSFVGRVDDVAQVVRLLDVGRLVTVTGPGGVGKTRLAVEVGRRRPDEVCFVDLASLVDGGKVAHASSARLVAALTGRRMLLILDNCEHL